MKMKFAVKRTEWLQFETELPKRFEVALLYENGTENPPTFFDMDNFSAKQENEFFKWLRQECVEKTGKTCDRTVGWASEDSWDYEISDD